MVFTHLFVYNTLTNQIYGDVMFLCVFSWTRQEYKEKSGTNLQANFLLGLASWLAHNLQKSSFKSKLVDYLYVSPTS